MSVRHLKRLFAPRSVALVGASAREGSIGAVLAANLLKSGFRGPVWPVNPKHKEIAGSRTFRDVADLPEVPDLAESLGTTRSAAAVELWLPDLEGAVVAIGNAPTALFHLLERLQEGTVRPAAILAFPVGFVGAAESKEALIESDLGIPLVTLRGRFGGSALAAAAVNGILAGLEG